MPRSSYIYLILECGGDIVATFTVKHEALTFFKKYHSGSNGDRLIRMVDGGHSLHNPHTAGDQIVVAVK